MVEKTWPIAEQLILNMLALAEQLHEQLSQEADILKSGGQEAELIDQSTSAKKQLLNQLEQLNQQFSQILTAEKLPNNQDGVNGYFVHAEAAGLSVVDTVSKWKQIQQVCSECKALNEQNGASIELLSLHAKRSLDILKGKTSGSNTYGRDGVTQSEALTHTLTFYL